VSTFDTDADGWSIVDLPVNGPYAIPVTNYSPVFLSAQGGSAGCIEFTDQTSNIYYFEAPSKFLGDRSSVYGLTLDFSLKISGPEDLIPSEPNVVLVGSGLVLVINVVSPPSKDQWSHFSITLHEQSDWRLDTLQGDRPTTLELKSALSSLTSLRIRGEYIAGVDVASLDDVVFGASFGGVTNVLIRTAVEVAWPSQSNVWYQVQWASALDTNTWLNLGGLFPGNGFTNTVLDSSWGLPKRFYRVLKSN